MLFKKKISVRYFEESATIGSWLTCQKDKGKRNGSKWPHRQVKKTGANLKELPVAKTGTIWATKLITVALDYN